MTTETQRHIVLPDGTVRLQAHAIPQRVRKPSGWVPVDTTLGVVDGRVVPAASVLDVSFSAGGDDELVTLADGDRRFGLSWPDRLPTPLLSGDTATYVDVRPGVDLLLRAEPDSFSQVLRVKTRTAAQDPRLARVAWQVTTTDGVAVRQTGPGAVHVVDESSGGVLFRSPESAMWAAPRPPEPQLADLARATGEPLHQSAERGPSRMVAIPVETSATELAVVPDTAMLADPGTVLPIMIDPSFGESPANWAPVLNTRPNDSWPSGSSWPRDYVRVGDVSGWANCGSGCGVWRSHLRFPISEMDGQELVENPEFRIRLDHSADCDPSPVELWRTNSIGSSGDVSWNDMTGKWLTNFGSRYANANETKCNQDNEWVEWATSTMRTKLQSAMDNGYSTFTFGLRAPNESNKYQWKRFHTGTANLSVIYNLPPNRPKNLTIAGDCYQACDEPGAVRALRPVLKAKVTDPNSDQLTEVQFQIRNEAKTSVVASGSRTNVAEGSSPTWQPGSDLSAGTTFHFRVRARDDHSWGSWSSYFTFTVDTTPPAVPTVSSESYPHKDTGTWNGGVGQSGQFTLDPNGTADVIEYTYRWLDGAETTLSTGMGQPLVATIAPEADLAQTLQVRSTDAAGNVSDWVSYPILVRPQPDEVAYWKFDEAAGTTAAPTIGDPSYTGQLHGGATWADSRIGVLYPEASGTAMSLDGSSGYVEMPRTLTTDHASGWSIIAWAKPDELSGDQTVLSQDGADHTMVRLHYLSSANGGAGGWCVTMRHEDVPDADQSQLCSPADQAQAGAWSHLSVVYDAPAGKLRLVVDGGPFNGDWPPGWQGEIAAPEAWSATGAFQIGRARTGAAGEPGAYWHGLVDEVRTHQRVLVELELQQNYLDCRYGTCPSVDPPDESCQAGTEDDFNGDGYGDVAIADPDATVNGQERAGRVHVIYGGGAGSHTVSQADGFVTGGPESGDRFGFSLATVDYNQDGCTDLVVGAPFEDHGTKSDSGFAQVLYGSPDGFGPNGNEAFSQDTSGMPGGTEAGDRFAYAIAAGTTAGSEPYLVFGVPGEDLDGSEDAGAINYVRGQTKLMLHQDSAGVSGVLETGDQYGYRVAASARHVAVGTPYEAQGQEDDAGTVHVFTHDLTLGNVGLWNQFSDDSGVAEAGDECGASLSMVDYIPGGSSAERSLLVLGCPGEAYGETPNSGRIVTVEADGTAISEIDSIDSGTSGVAGAVEAEDYFGRSVVAANRTPGSAVTWRDLVIAVGMPGEDSSGETGNGDVQVFSAVGPPGDHDAWVADGGLAEAGWAPTSDAHLGTYIGATASHLYVADPDVASPAVYAIPWQNLTDGATGEVRVYHPGADGLPTSGVGTFGGAVS